MLVWNVMKLVGVFNCWSFYLKTCRLCSIAKSFGRVRLPNWIEVNRTIGVRLGSIGFDYRRSIDHARGMKAQLNSKITPVTCHSKFCFNERSCQFHVLLVVKEHQKPLNCQLITYYRFQVQQSHKQSTLSATSVDKVRLTWSPSLNSQTFVHPFGNTNVTCSDLLFGPFSSSFCLSGSSNYRLKLKYFFILKNPERPL